MNTSVQKLLHIRVCNGDRVRQLRAELRLTQERLAQLSHVDVRTIQRAEKGMNVSMETIADLASALKTDMNELVLQNSTDEGGFPLELDESRDVVLRRVTSGKSLQDMICGSFSGSVSCYAEPTVENIEALAAMIEKLEGLMPDPWEPPSDSGPVPLADRLRSAVNLTTQLKELENVGLGVYAATYSARAKVPRYDPYCEHSHNGMYTTHSQEFEKVTVCCVGVEKLGKDKFVVMVQDKWTGRLSDQLDDDTIPF